MDKIAKELKALHAQAGALTAHIGSLRMYYKGLLEDKEEEEQEREWEKENPLMREWEINQEKCQKRIEEQQESQGVNWDKRQEKSQRMRNPVGWLMEQHAKNPKEIGPLTTRFEFFHDQFRCFMDH